jgi:hypothetical protein
MLDAFQGYAAYASVYLKMFGPAAPPCMSLTTAILPLPGARMPCLFSLMGTIKQLNIGIYMCWIKTVA